MSYCQAARDHPEHGPYHDGEYGFPQRGDDALFERLTLEIMQAGLSWLTILKKRANFRAAFQAFDVDAVAAFTDEDRARLLADAGIVRHRQKIDAVIHNAGVIQTLRDEYGSLAAWLDAHHPRDRGAWVRLFRTTFRFTGGEIVNEFLLSTGYLPGAHTPDCPIFERVLAARPPWVDTPGGAAD